MAYRFPRCQIIPLPDQQVSFQIDGVERTRWHFASSYPRPFFYPLVAPSGSSLTRMGHPGAANHDHHRSVWFAHYKVLGIDFWSDRTDATIRQQQWLAYEDGNDEAIMAVSLGWYDGHDPRELLQQQLVAAVRPATNQDTFLELQSTFTPVAESLEFGQTNFGFLAVRVAKQISAYFGGGQLTDSEGRTGEPAIFGQRARWMDYTGPAPNGESEGITYFDHPKNPGYPCHWHVREDGWMGASVCLERGLVTYRDSPLTLRYLLHVHADRLRQVIADEIAGKFADLPRFEVARAEVKHRQFVIHRAAPTR